MKDLTTLSLFSYAVIPVQVEFLFLFIPVTDLLRLSLTALSNALIFSKESGVELTSVSMKFEGAIALYPDLTEIGDLFSFQPFYSRKALSDLEQERSGFQIVQVLDVEKAKKEQWNLSGECHISLSSSRLVTFYFPDHENNIRQTYSLTLDCIHDLVDTSYNQYLKSNF